MDLSEDDFRDHIIRPLFLRRGLSDGRDLCGKLEKGKDTIFISKDPMGLIDVYAVQTKKGNLNMAKRAASNVVEAVTQLKTALSTYVVILKTKEKKYPSKVFLCASGKINETAQDYIIEEVKSPMIVFMDSNDLIPSIDEMIPEVWFRIDKKISPYLEALKSYIEDKDQLFTKTEFMPDNIIPIAASTDLFIPLRLHRYTMKISKVSGKVEQVPHFEEVPILGIHQKSHRLILILGSAGTGKTTSLLRLIYILADRGLHEDDPNKIRIPIYLHSQEILPEPSLLDSCVKVVQNISKSSNLPFSSSDLDLGNVIILIDALDEVSDREKQDELIKKIMNFHEIYPKCQVIITSRDYSFISEIKNLYNFIHYSLSPINYKQAQKILLRLNKKKSLPIDKSSEILRRMQNVHGIELNPLLVTVFAASTDYARADIPANITELFKKFTELMLGRWDANKGLALQYIAPLKDFILQKIAFDMHQKGLTKLSIQEFRDIASRELQSRGYEADVDILLDEILFRSGLFRITGNLIEFRHLMLQEFFAGRGIPDIETLKSIICDDWWRRAIVFYFGENPENIEVFNILMAIVLSRKSQEIFNALVTMGLSLQASYLVKVSDKLNVILWLINNLAAIQKSYEEEVVNLSKYPLHAFLYYYIFARDAVALNTLKDNHQHIISVCVDSEEDKNIQDLRLFWIIIGLIEIGELSLVDKLLKGYHPKDLRLLLGIHLGCFLTQHVRVTTNQERDHANKICDGISSQIGSLRVKLKEEFISELLELKDKVIEAHKLLEEAKKDNKSESVKIIEKNK